MDSGNKYFKLKWTLAHIDPPNSGRQTGYIFATNVFILIIIF